MGKGQLYEIESIQDKKKIDNKWHYEIKWKDYDSDNNTWEPVDNIKNCK